MKGNFQDFLGWMADPDILKIIKDEELYYSNKIQKYNSLKIGKARNIVITNKSIYNFQNKKMKRNMKYEEVKGITFSSQSNEFVVHGNEGYDLYFGSPEKIAIIYIIAKCYEKIKGQPIILYEVKDKSLKHYVTAKKDKKKDLNNSRLDDKNIIDTQTFLIDYAPEELIKRSFTEQNGKITNFESIQENPKNIESIFIFSNDKNIENIGFKDFEIIKILGKGVSGKVFLAKNKINNQFYALKSADKKIFEIDESSLKKIENFTKNLKFPFLINADFCFENNERIYFAFPYIEGEELLYHLKIKNNFDEEKIKFYASIIALTFDYFHKNEIEYKSFGLKNIIIDKDGYLKIIPFHTGKIFQIKSETNKSKKMLEKYKNEYTPPEIYSEMESQNLKSADWWNLGVIIYEMAYGIPPFYSDIYFEMKNEVVNNELKFPKITNISDNLKDLLDKLLTKKCEERLGYENGFEDIKNHAFFKDYKFDELLSKNIESPYKPTNEDIIQINKIKEEKFTYDDLKKSGIIY